MMSKMMYDLQFLFSLSKNDKILTLCYGGAGKIPAELLDSGYDVSTITESIIKSKNCRLPFFDNSFSVIIIHKAGLPFVLRRSLSSSKKIVREAYRILRPGGRLVVFGREVFMPLGIFERIISFPAYPVQLADYDSSLMSGLKFEESRRFGIYPSLKHYIYVFPLESHKLSLTFLRDNFNNSSIRIGFLSSLMWNIKLESNLLAHDYYLVARKAND